MFTVYAIVNESEKIYIGQTSDIEKRLLRHNCILKNKNKSFTSKNKGNWKIFYKENHKTRIDATAREKQLKSYQGRKFLRDVLINDKTRVVSSTGRAVAS